MELEFGRRLNFLTGDNGLGKSLLLDIAWWAMTRTWPTGRKALPVRDGAGQISFSFAGGKIYESQFSRRDQAWTGRAGRPANPGLVIYAMADGGFAVWDPARNYWKPESAEFDGPNRIPAYVFGPSEVWDGLQGKDGSPLCNGLLRDWAGWQKQRGAAWKNLRAVLEVLSPSANEPLKPGKSTRISLDDARDIPTIRMPYGQEVAILHASAGMRRIFALAYLLVWAWEEHKKAATLLGEKTTKQVVFLIDEIESHLHPQWQRVIVPALIGVVNKLIDSSEVQIIAATHSPLIMVSVEPLFDPSSDAWFDIDMQKQKVTLQRREFKKQGDAEAWLTSEAFDLASGRPVPYEVLVEKASALVASEKADTAAVQRIHQDLVNALKPGDPFLLRWRYICGKKGLLP